MTELDERFLDVTEHGVLSIPASLRVSWVILARHWVLLLIGLATMLVSDASTTNMVRSAISWQALIFQAPIVCLIYIAGRRQPGAPAWIRWSWTHGAQLMLLSAVLGCCWLAYWLYTANTWSKWPELFLASTAVLDVALVWNVFTSTYLRQVFREFPEAH